MMSVGERVSTGGQRRQRGIEGTGEWVIEMIALHLRAVLSMCILSLRKTLFYWLLKSLEQNYVLPRMCLYIQ